MREQLPAAPDDFALGGGIQRYYLDALLRGVPPDVELGPVRQGERTNPYALANAPVVHPIAERGHRRQLLRGVDVQPLERNASRVKRVLRKAQQHGRVVADGVHHHRLLEFRYDLAQDVDAFGFEAPQDRGRSSIRSSSQRPLQVQCEFSRVSGTSTKYKYTTTFSPRSRTERRNPQQKRAVMQALRLAPLHSQGLVHAR
jgi:hypothetical protein